MKNADYRLVAHSVLRDQGFEVREKPGRGFLLGSRVVALRGKKETAAVVKAAQERTVSFTKQTSTRWRTLHAADLVVAVVPAADDPDEAEVFAFERKPLERIFNRAWKALENANRPAGFDLPVFIPLDARARKKVGHEVNNLKKLALWSVRLTADELARRSKEEEEESYVDKFRRRFAAENDIDMAQVVISIMGKPK